MTKLVLVIAALLLCVVSASASWCGVQTVYFQHNASTSPAGYEELINFPSGNTEVDETVSLINTGGLTLIDNYISPAGSLANTISQNEGLRRFRVYAYVSSASGTTTLNFTAFRRYANGTEQNLYSAQTEDIDALTVTEYDLNYVVQNPVSFNPTDRIGMRVYGLTTHSSPITLHWVYQGTTHTSHYESGFFVCNDVASSQAASTKYTPETSVAIMIVFGIVGGIIGYLILSKYRTT